MQLDRLAALLLGSVVLGACCTASINKQPSRVWLLEASAPSEDAFVDVVARRMGETRDALQVAVWKPDGDQAVDGPSDDLSDRMKALGFTAVSDVFGFQSGAGHVSFFRNAAACPVLPDAEGRISALLKAADVPHSFEISMVAYLVVPGSYVGGTIDHLQRTVDITNLIAPPFRSLTTGRDVGPHADGDR